MLSWSQEQARIGELCAKTHGASPPSAMSLWWSLGWARWSNPGSGSAVDLGLPSPSLPPSFFFTRPNSSSNYTFKMATQNAKALLIRQVKRLFSCPYFGTTAEVFGLFDISQPWVGIVNSTCSGSEGSEERNVGRLVLHIFPTFSAFNGDLLPLVCPLCSY